MNRMVMGRLTEDPLGNCATCQAKKVSRHSLEFQGFFLFMIVKTPHLNVCHYMGVNVANNAASSVGTSRLYCFKHFST